MTIERNIFGHRYDTDEPCFLSTVAGDMVWNRITGKWQGTAALLAKAAAEGHTWAEREIGIPSLGWQLRHRNFNYGWGPGLDDTSGLASELIVNGEDWTDATGTTPPTGWTAGGLAPRFTVDAGVLKFDATAAGGHSMSQDITVVAGTPYVLEIGLVGASDATLEVNGVSVPLSSSGSFSASIIPEGTTVSITINIGATGSVEVDYIRCYLEAELTGSGATTMTPVPLPVVTIKGPYVAQDINFFTAHYVDGREPTVGFDVDSEPDADLFLSLAGVCESTLNNGIKRIISRRLVKNGWASGLPCDVTADAGDK